VNVDHGIIDIISIFCRVGYACFIDQEEYIRTSNAKTSQRSVALLHQ
jgi:hypothetical protein